MSQDDNDDYSSSSEEQEGQRNGAAGNVVPDADAQFEKLKRWFLHDFNSHGQVTWRREAREDFAFEAGDQLTEEDKQILKDAQRPVVIFNRIGVSVDSVAGQEVANRQEVQFLPRQQGQVKVNELLTSAAKWFRQQCDAEDEESDAFRDTVVCGMGWTETRLDYEDNPDGEPKIDRIDPLEMVWDSSAKKRNLVDSRRVFHIKRNVPIEEARALCPGDPDQPWEDSDYNATWVDERAKGEPGDPHEVDANFYTRPENNAKGENDDDKTVTLVRAQWWERVPVYLVLDPTNPQNVKTLQQDEFADMRRKMAMVGADLRYVKQTRRVYRQAYLGSVLLESGDAPIKGHFSFNAITGKRDRNKNTFYGIVRAMKDPARWSNKWMSQTMHIMNTTAKGGIAAERGQFFDDDQDGEASWAKQDQVTYLKPGALSGSNPKWVPKPTGQFPQGTFELMNFAVQSLPQVSGVNIETLGMQASADQAAALDRQRKQSVMIILQPLFDGLRRYRKVQGRGMLFLIQNYLSDGRLIKIEGPQDAQYVPLIRQADAQYDVIVDEAPTSPNQKELTWTLLQQILPVIGKMLPPATWLALLKYSPLPTSAQQDISQSIQQSQQQPDPQQQKIEGQLKLQQGQLAIKQATAQADIANERAKTAAKIQGDREQAHAKMQIEAHRAHVKSVSEAAAEAIGAQQQSESNDQVLQAIQGLQQQIGSLVQALQGQQQAQ